MIKIAFYPLNFLVAILSFAAAYLIISGIAMEWVQFSNATNELGCFIICCFMGVLALVSSFGRPKVEK